MKKFFSFLFYCFLFGTIFTIFAIWFVVLYYNDQLPDIEKINTYNPPLTSRLYSVDGVLLKEYAEEKRLFVSIENVPELVKQAFIAAEDNNFYKHNGIDFEAILSAVVYNAKAYISNTRMRGASTITQQVVKNFLLSNERTIERKIKEAILSFKISQIFTIRVIIQ